MGGVQRFAIVAALIEVWAADFSIQVSKTEGNDADFQSDTSGLCAFVLASLEDLSCDVFEDCSPMNSYACSSISSSITDVEGTIEMSFSGTVASPYEECGEQTCPSCTAYKTCVGPMIQTDTQALTAGQCILWEYTTVGGSDAFEVFVGVYDSDNRLVTSTWMRGTGSNELPWNYQQLDLEVSGNYYLKFYLASYDETGGSALGARMDVRNIRSTNCLDESELGTEITVTEYVSTTSTTVSTSTKSSTSSSSTSSSGTSSSSTSSSSTSSSSTSGSSTSSSSSSSTSSSTTSSSSTSSASTSSTSSTSSSTTSWSSTSTTSSSTSITNSTTTSSTTTTSVTFTSTSRTTSTSSFSTSSTISTSISTSTSSITSSSSSTSATTTSQTRTEIPTGGISAAELEALEAERKRLAAQAVAAVESAENEAVLQALDALQNSNSTTAGVLGEVSIQTSAGPVKVAALSLESLADADGPAKITAGEDSGASLEISLGLLGAVAEVSGSDTVLLSVASINDDASSNLRTDNVLAEPGRRLAASALRSRPISINFRTTQGGKIDVTNLAEPMRMVLEIDDPAATCAFWDEETAQWSSAGVETLPQEEGPGTIVCSTTHLSIFGGIIKVALRNVALTFECSTFSSLMTASAFRSMSKPGWLGRPASVLVISLTLVFLVLLAASCRADQRSFDILPWSEREHMLMRIKASDPKTEEPVKEQPKEQQEEQVPEKQGSESRKKVPGEHDMVLEDYEEDDTPDPSNPVREDGSVEADEGEQCEAGYETGEKSTAKKKQTRRTEKDTAAGGDFEVPSIFRTVRGTVEGLLDMLSNATGGEGLLDGIKEIVANAETGTINRSIAMLQSHRSGADQTTIQVLQRGGTVAVDDDVYGHTQSAEKGPQTGHETRRQEETTDKSPDVQRQTSRDVEGATEHVLDDAAAVKPKTSVTTLELESFGTEDDKDESPRTEAEHQALPDGQRQRRRSSIQEMIGVAVTVARRRGSQMMQKANVMYGHLAESGSGAATRFLNTNVLCRTLLLFPAAHNWAKVNQISISVPYSVRVGLIGMKIFSAGMFNAIFFSTTTPAPDSDPECFPEEGSFAALVQQVTVGIVSAVLGDLVILLLLLFVKKGVKERVEWTKEMRRLQRRKWFRRTCFFWIFTAFYMTFCVLYMTNFLSNVREVDAAKWLRCTCISILQDFILKPLILAAILAIMSSLVLRCRPKIKRQIEEKWLQAARTPSTWAVQERRDSFGSSSSGEEDDERESVNGLAEEPASASQPYREAEESGLRAMRSMLGESQGTDLEEDRRLHKSVAALGSKEPAAESSGFTGILPGAVHS